MEITEVRVYLRENEDKKLKAYATITFDNAFVVRDLKVIDGKKGLFVAMPSRKLKEACPECSHRNVVKSKFCCECGRALQGFRVTTPMGEGRDDHRDVAHPITPVAREYIQKTVLEAYETERQRPQQL